MKKSFLFLSMIGVLALTSCGGDKETLEEQIEYYPVTVGENENWGFLGSNGEVLFADNFKNEPSAVINGYFKVQEGETYSLYEISEKPNKPVLSDMNSIGVVMDGVVPAAPKKDRIKLYNTDGEELFELEPQGGKEIVGSNPYVSDGLLVAWTSENKYGAFNKDGEVVIEFKYDKLGDFKDGLAVAKKVNDGKATYMIINKDNEEVAKFSGDNFILESGLYKGYFRYQDGERVGFIDKDGEKYQMPTSVKEMRDYNSDYIIMKDDNGWGIMTFDLEEPEVVLKGKYDSMEFVPGESDKFLVKDNNGKYFVIDTEGEKVVSFSEDFKNVIPVYAKGFRYVATDNNKQVLLNEDGERIDKKVDYKSLTTSADESPVNSGKENSGNGGGDFGGGDFGGFGE